MSNLKNNKKTNVGTTMKANNTPVKKNNKVWLYSAGALLLLVVVIVALANNAGSNNLPSTQGTTNQISNTQEPTSQATSIQGKGITIKKSEITSTATFIPYTAGNTKMEVLAVKAPDGTIRTALNTCQVCNNSGRGYYVQEGDVLVCQNCGNKFKISQVELIKGGCNPVPILKENKTENDKTITIPDSFLQENTSLFTTWKS